MYPGAGLGEEMRRRRLAAGRSLRDLSAEIHYSRGYLSKVENMLAPASAELVRLYDGALGAGGRLIARMAMAPAESRARPAALGEAPAMVAALGQAHWLDPAVGRPLAGAGGLLPASGMWLPSRVSPAQAEWVTGVLGDWFGQLRSLGRQGHPRVLLPTLIAQARTLQVLAGSASATSRPAVLALAARYAEFTGWMAQEAGDDRSALWWTDLAAELAHVSGDPAMAGHAHVRRALLALYRGDAAQTVALARLAQQQPRLPARERGLAVLREAQGLALAGEYDPCRRTLDRAQQILATVDPGGSGPAGSPTQVLGPSTVADPVQMTTGWCLHDLGRPAEAAAVLDREVTRLPGDGRRAGVRYGTRRALAYAVAGEVDHACALAGSLIPGAADVASATIRHDLRQLARALRRWPTRPAVREILPDLDRLVRTCGAPVSPEE